MRDREGQTGKKKKEKLNEMIGKYEKKKTNT